MLRNAGAATKPLSASIRPLTKYDSIPFFVIGISSASAYIPIIPAREGRFLEAS
jgi:hypothetical protein